MKTKQENLKCVLEFKIPEKIPFIIWNTAPFCCSLAGVKQKEYYLDANIKLKVHLGVQKEFQESILFPDPWPDFGASLEPSMFGCEPIWYENQPPSSQSVISEYKDIPNIKFTPKNSLLPIMLAQYEYVETLR